MSESKQKQTSWLKWIIAVVLVVALVALTWWIAGLVQSPAQKDAAAAAPSPAPVVVQVKKGDLHDEITSQAWVAAARETQASLTLSDAARNVVTRRTVKPGDTLKAGQAPLWVNDRPIIVLSGSFPMYRDLTQGDTGEDVKQLQNALRVVGYTIAADGEFGTGTATALKLLYQNLGATVPTVASQSKDTTDSSSETEQAQPDQADQKTDKKSQTLVTLPQSEVVFVKDFTAPQTIIKLPALGTILSADNATLALASGTGVVRSEVTAAVANTLPEGTEATVTIDGTSIPLQLKDITENTQGTDAQSSDAGGGTSPAATYNIDFEPVDSQQTLTPTDSDAGLLLTIERTGAIKDALLVPKRALASAPDGSYSVLKENNDTTFTSVPVNVLACVGGQCALDKDSSLAVGDNVRVDGQ